MTPIHYTANYLLNPTNPITVNLIGAGGTGSQVLMALGRMNHALIGLGHPGLSVQVWDDDTVTEANLGRQLFADSELGMSKAGALINRVNRFFGTNWKAVVARYTKGYSGRQLRSANLTLSCVDTVVARRDIAAVLWQKPEKLTRMYGPHSSLYWMDFGNGQYTGQVILSTVGHIDQPQSEKHVPVGVLPFVTEEFTDLLEAAVDDNTPSCSLAEALTKQDLFINSTLAQMGCALLWNLFRNGMTEYRGLFLNLQNMRSVPINV